MEFSSNIFDFDVPSDGCEGGGGAGYEAQGSQDVTGHLAQEFSFPQDNYLDQNMGTQFQQDSFITPGANNEFGVTQPLVPDGSQIFGDARDYLPTLTSYHHPSPAERQPARGSLPDLGSAHYPLGSGAINMQNTNQPVWPPTEQLNMNSGHCAQPVMSGAYRNPQVGSEWTSMAPNPATQAVDSRDQIRAVAMYSPARAVPITNDLALTEARCESSAPPAGQQSIIPRPIATIMADGYDVFNPAVLARVENDCKTHKLRNTPFAIATYHQVAMAKDLYSKGIWRRKFYINQGAIFDFYTPALSHRQVPDIEQKVLRLLFRLCRRRGETAWYKVVKRNWLIPAGRMELPPAEYVDALDLWKYFFMRAQCAESAEKYAELVAPGYIDNSPEAHRANTIRVGMFLGANQTTAALRLAPAAEALSQEALELPDFIPTVRASSPVEDGIAGVQAAKPTQADAGAASNIQNTSTGAFHDPNSNTAYLNTLPDQGMVSGSTNPFISLPPGIISEITSLPGWIWPFTPEGIVNSGTDANVADMSAASHLAVGGDGMDPDASGPTFDPFGIFPGFDDASGAAESSFGFSNPYGTGIPPNGENYSVFEDMASFDAAAVGHTTTSDSNNGLNIYGDNSLYDGNSTIGNHAFGNAPMFDSSFDGSFDGSLFATSSSDGNDFFTNSFHLPCVNEEQEDMGEEEEVAVEEQAEDTPMALR
ncbi:hypothetical protein F5Y07DRAFT_405772 [Xylaria sp. FL0933]|nr:hypothetical protein F5Y07DRAFT_405772 [Xylaria sp. FL0933]